MSPKIELSDNVIRRNKNLEMRGGQLVGKDDEKLTKQEREKQ